MSSYKFEVNVAALDRTVESTLALIRASISTNGEITLNDVCRLLKLPTNSSGVYTGWTTGDSFRVTTDPDLPVGYCWVESDWPVDLTVENDPAEPVDIVNHPPHYQSNTGLEVIEAIKAFVEDYPSYCAGNVLKYVCRYRHKNGLEDLKKARWYLDELINHIEKESNQND